MSLFDKSLLTAAKPTVAPLTNVAAFTGLGDDAWEAASRSLDVQAHPAGMVRPFLPWQAAAFLYCLDSIERWGGSLLGDDMGMGKTQVLLALMSDALGKARAAGNAAPYAIAISPTVAEYGYRGDLHAAFPNLVMHTVKGRTLPTLCSTCGASNRGPKSKRQTEACTPVLDLPVADIYFISDDALTLKAWLAVEHKMDNGKFHTEATEWATNAALIVRDEIHRDKGDQGKATTRSRVMLAVGNAMRSIGKAVVGATGTLLTNRPVEAFIPLQIVGGERLVTTLTPGAHQARSFLWAYCNPQEIRVAGGRKVTIYNGTNVDACLRLHDYLRRTVYVRREKTDLADGQMPNSGFLVVPMALPMEKTMRLLRIERDLLSLISEESGPAAAMRAQSNETLRQVMLMWEECGVSKAEATLDYVQRLQDEDGKQEQVVVFFHHEKVRDALMNAAIHANVSFNVIDGKVTGDARQQAIAEFQAGKVTVCFANLQAAGMAVTLTAAKHAAFVQCPWSAGSLKQACDRILRVDDRTRARAANGEEITWHVLQTCWENGDQTFDASILQVVQDKALVCDSVNAGKAITITEENMAVRMLENWVPSAKSHGMW